MGTCSPSRAAMRSRWRRPASSIAVLDGPGPHTNHYQDPDLAAIGPAPSEGSRSRLERIDQLLIERDPQTVEQVMAIMRDHESSPQAICLHPDPAEGEDASAVMFSMVAELEEGRCGWHPAIPANEYEEIDLTGVR